MPLRVRHPEHALLWAEQLRQAGLLVPAVRPPTVPLDESLLRISLTWRHTIADLQQLTDCLAELRDRLPPGAP